MKSINKFTKNLDDNLEVKDNTENTEYESAEGSDSSEDNPYTMKMN